MRKTGWEEPTKGPDWTDVEMLMRAIGAVHSGHVAVIISPHGTGSTGGVDVAASMLFDVLPGSSLPSTVQVTSPWPCKSHKTLASHAFEALHRLDFQIGETYKQESLWE
jgi:hypothetical protein